MSAPCRLAPRVCRFCRAAPSPTLLRRTFTSAIASTTTTTSSGDASQSTAWPQRKARGEYYDILLRDPIPYSHYTIERPAVSSTTAAAAERAAASSTTKTATSSSPARTYETIASRTAYSGVSSTSTNGTTAEERARVIFGSRLVGPAERAKREAGRAAQSSRIAGILVPPRPEEPDSCCMSGCVNCVWDLYREEMEEWTAKSNEAKRRLAEEAVGAASSSGGGKGLADAPADRPASVDADNNSSGGGKGAAAAGGEAKIAKDMWTEDLFQNVPVGIREFMKQEKRLKEKHQREGTSGG